MNENENRPARSGVTPGEAGAETALGREAVPSALPAEPGHAAVADRAPRPVALHYGPGCTGSMSHVRGPALQAESVPETMDGEKDVKLFCNATAGKLFIDAMFAEGRKSEQP